MTVIHVKLIRIGNSIGVRLPKTILTASGLKEGDYLDFEFKLDKPRIRIKNQKKMKLLKTSLR